MFWGDECLHLRSRCGGVIDFRRAGTAITKSVVCFPRDETDGHKGKDVMVKPKIVICMGSSCFARGNEKTVEACESFLAARGLKDEVDVDLGASLCTGNCADGPIVVVDGKIYKHVDPLVMRDILEATFPEKG